MVSGTDIFSSVLTFCSLTGKLTPVMHYHFAVQLATTLLARQFNGQIASCDKSIFCSLMAKLPPVIHYCFAVQLAIAPCDTVLFCSSIGKFPPVIYYHFHFQLENSFLAWIDL